jgi:hypothetical protein
MHLPAGFHWRRYDDANAIVLASHLDAPGRALALWPPSVSGGRGHVNPVPVVDSPAKTPERSLVSPTSPGALLTSCCARSPG